MTESFRRRRAVERRPPRSCRYVLDSNAFSNEDGISAADVETVLAAALSPYGCIYIGNRASHEIHDERTPAHLRRLAANFIHVATSSLADTPGEGEQRASIRRHFSGNAKPGKHESDADILFDAVKYQCDFIVTNDARLIEKVATCPGVQVATLAPSAFVAAIRRGDWAD